MTSSSFKVIVGISFILFFLPCEFRTLFAPQLLGAYDLDLSYYAYSSLLVKVYGSEAGIDD